MYKTLVCTTVALWHGDVMVTATDKILFVSFSPSYSDANIYFAAGRDAKYCDEVMSMSVCQSTCITRKPHGRSYPNFHPRCLRPWLSVLDMLCTSGFLDDVGDDILQCAAGTHNRYMIKTFFHLQLLHATRCNNCSHSNIVGIFQHVGLRVPVKSGTRFSDPGGT